jgi:UDP:flavonoid glycosyltransferase YjiC (YdhE family)
VNLQLEKKPEELMKFADIANKLRGIKKLEGIVLVSFGTVYGPLTPLTEHEFSVILNAIESRPSFLFIWQMPTEDERAERVNKLANGYTAAWIPQPAILGINN